VWRTGTNNRNLFQIAPILHHGAYHQLKEDSGKYFRLGLIFALVILILFLQSFKHWQRRPVLPVVPEAVLVLTVEDVPVTTQTVRRPAPPLPVVPVPTDEVSVPVESTIEKTELDFTAMSAGTDSGHGEATGQGQGSGETAVVVPPRPIADVFPEYPPGEKKKGVQGEIELTLLVDESGKVQNVQVVRNTTQSAVCEAATVDAAYQTRFLPARNGQEMVAVWIHKTYKFSLD